jgi:hypothetical protein
MRTLILISSGVLWNSLTDQFYPGVLDALSAIRKNGHGVFLVSNHAKPKWLTDEYKFITFQACRSRQDGKIVDGLIKANDKVKLQHSEVVIFGCNDDDMQMAANSQTLLIRCEWAALGENIKRYGVPWDQVATLPELVNFLENKEPWFFKSQDTFLTVMALTDAGTKFESNSDVRRLVMQLQACLKDSRPELKNGFILHLLSSIYATEDFAGAHIWGVYPSSASKNDGSEIMAGFCGLARALYKKKMKEPLLIRHKPSAKRHIVGGDRDDPSSQIETVHLNPFYEGKLKGKTVVVLDDYLNRGVSFGVSASLLEAAGAAKVIGVVMGKFGNRAQRYEIDIADNPFAPVMNYKETKRSAMTGKSVHDAKLAFLKKFKVKA